MNRSPPAGITIDPDVVVGRGTFGTVYGCIADDGVVPVVGKQVVTQDMNSHIWAMNEVGVQQYVYATFGCAPYIERVDYGPEPVRRNSPNSFYRVVTIYQERLETSLGSFIKSLIQGRFAPFDATMATIKILLGRVAAEVQRFGETTSTSLVLHGDLTPDNVLLGMAMPNRRMSISEIQESARTCRICIIDYGYAALYSPGLRTRLSPCYTRLRYHHSFPVWYDRAFFLFTSVGHVAYHMRCPVQAVLRFLKPDWITVETFHAAVADHAGTDVWQWIEVWESYCAEHGIVLRKRVSGGLQPATPTTSIPSESHVTTSVGVPDGSLRGLQPPVHDDPQQRAVSGHVSISDHPFWGRGRHGGDAGLSAVWSNYVALYASAEAQRNHLRPPPATGE